MFLGVDFRRRLGIRGESAAVSALRDRGYRVISRNVRSRAGEIDLVCLDGATFVFCEVKSRRPSPFGAPEEALTAKKRRRLARLAAGYLAWAGRRGASHRLELVAVRLGPEGEPVAVEVIPIV